MSDLVSGAENEYDWESRMASYLLLRHQKLCKDRYLTNFGTFSRFSLDFFWFSLAQV